jgi:hypothetical protein
MRKEKVGQKGQKAGSLILKKETLGSLDGAKLRAVVGGARAHYPIGYADDTSPIYPIYDDAP